MDGRLSNATPGPAGRGSAYDYRPSPRQLRRSSPKRMMCRSLAQGRGSGRPVPVCGTAAESNSNSDGSLHFANPRLS
ncbi:hypothetical protein EF906_06470 [Streptomyces sp. WAC08241]|nr:hypothetical protein EF906_06470 [Streptomyces sp. WAC08241]